MPHLLLVLNFLNKEKALGILSCTGLNADWLRKRIFFLIILVQLLALDQLCLLPA